MGRGEDMKSFFATIAVACLLCLVATGCKRHPPTDRIDHSLVFGVSAADPYQHSLIIVSADNGHACGETGCPPPDFTQPIDVVLTIKTSVPVGAAAPSQFKKLRAVVCTATTDDQPHECSGVFNIV